MIPGKGVMVVMALRYVRGVVNAMRKPAGGDIVVPQHEVAILGTTSVEVASPDDIHVSMADVDKMIDMCSQMIFSIAGGRALRAFAGSRPLYKAKAAVDAGVDELEDLRRMLRVGYGPCQGGFCVWRAVAMLFEGFGGAGGRDAMVNLERFVEERWRGQRPTIWGDQARQLLLNQAIYRGIFDLGPEVRPDEAVELPAATGALAPAPAGGAGSA